MQDHCCQTLRPCCGLWGVVVKWEIQVKLHDTCQSNMIDTCPSLWLTRVLQFYSFTFLNATGDLWPHSFWSVRLPVTGFGRWQPNQPFPSGTKNGIFVCTFNMMHNGSLSFRRHLDTLIKVGGFTLDPLQNPPKAWCPQHRTCHAHTSRRTDKHIYHPTSGVYFLLHSLLTHNFTVSLFEPQSKLYCDQYLLWLILYNLTCPVFNSRSKLFVTTHLM
jgi:hypothetical protein